jgi:excisionase family DNA binding protein
MSSSGNQGPDGGARHELWTALDVARYLKVSRSWVYHRAEAGELPCLRIGNFLRFDPDAVRAFARSEPLRGKILPFRRPGTPGTDGAPK